MVGKMIGQKHWLEQLQAERDALPEWDATGTKYKCKHCGGVRMRLKENNGAHDTLFCADCPERRFVDHRARSVVGKAQRSLNSRPDLPSGIREFVFRRANHRCELCGRAAGEGFGELEVAHALSIDECRRQGVPEDEWHHESNLYASCKECNHDMGSRSLEPRQMARLLHARFRSGQKLTFNREKPQ